MCKEVNKMNYVTIMGWMVQDLHLKGNELLIYALIHGFSQDGETFFSGSVSYIQSWSGLSKTAVLGILKSLVEKGFLEKQERVMNGVRFCYYKSLPPVHFFDHPGQETLPNNNNDNNINISINPLTPAKFSFLEALVGLGVSKETAQSWMQVRKVKKMVNTEIAFRAIEREIAKSGREAEECVRLAVVKSWGGFKAEWMENEIASRSRNPQGAERSPRRGGDSFGRMLDVGRELGIFGGMCDEQ